MVKSKLNIDTNNRSQLANDHMYCTDNMLSIVNNFCLKVTKFSNFSIFIFFAKFSAYTLNL